MVATVLTFGSILKEFYLGPVQEQLNNETLVLDLMTKMSVDWNGRLAHIPVHLARNNGTAYIGEAGALPAAGEQDYQNYTVNAAFLYGRFEVTGPAIASAGQGGKNTFIGWMDAEMDKLVTDVKNESDQACFSGDRLIGFLNEKQAPGAASVWEFTGDIAKVEALRLQSTTTIVAGLGTELQVAFIRYDINNVDSYEYIDFSPAVPTVITATDPANSTVTIAGALDTTTVDGGFAVGVLVVDNSGPTVPPVVATPGIAAVLGGIGAAHIQPVGIYGNLGGQIDDLTGVVAGGPVNQFTVNRTGAPGTAASSLQSNILTMTVGTAAATSNRAALDLPRIQQVFDQVLVAADTEPDCLVMHPTMRQQYVALMQLTMQTFTNKAEQGDAGFTGLSYGGVPIKTARHCARGMIIFLQQKTWKMLQLEPGGFADLDGNVLSRVAGQDSWEGFYRWYYNSVCMRPNANALLVGINL